MFRYIRIHEYYKPTQFAVFFSQTSRQRFGSDWTEVCDLAKDLLPKVQQQELVQRRDREGFCSYASCDGGDDDDDDG